MRPTTQKRTIRAVLATSVVLLAQQSGAWADVAVRRLAGGPTDDILQWDEMDGRHLKKPHSHSSGSSKCRFDFARSRDLGLLC